MPHYSFVPADQRKRRAPLAIRGLIIYLREMENVAWRVVDYSGTSGGKHYTLTLAELASPANQHHMSSTEIEPLLQSGKLAVRCDSVLR